MVQHLQAHQNAQRDDAAMASPPAHRRSLRRATELTRRDDWTWQQLRARFKAHCRARNAPCWICVQRGADPSFAQIDYNALPLSPNAFECDHVRPWETHPEARYLWNNLAASHSRCNRQRGKRMQTSEGTQQMWIKPDW